MAPATAIAQNGPNKKIAARNGMKATDSVAVPSCMLTKLISAAAATPSIAMRPFENLLDQSQVSPRLAIISATTAPQAMAVT